MSKKKQPSNRGGNRPGAGRPILATAKRERIFARVSVDAKARVVALAAKRGVSVPTVISDWAESLPEP